MSDASSSGDDGINSIADQTGMDPGTVRSMPPGCFLVFIFVFALIGFGIYAGLADTTPTQAARETAPLEANPSAAPIIQPPASTQPSTPSSTPISTPTTNPATPTTAPPPSSTTTPSTQPTPTTAPPAPPPPTTTAPPAPPPTTVSCGFPSSISVGGGTNLSLPGSGGSFQVAQPPITLSTSVVDCGQGHYMLSWNYNNPDGSFGNGSDCQHSSFNDNVAGAEPGGSVSVSLALPPNSCGP